MTSKSPVRSCEDVDETALSYAEIKALCAGNPLIKEKMDLDIDVARLRLLKADHQNQQFKLEDNILKNFPEQIERNKGYLAGFQADLATLGAHPHPAEGFAGMTVKGDTLTDKDNAGAAILEACKEVKSSEPVEIGTYRGFPMLLSTDGFHHQLVLKGEMSHKTDLGLDARGNLIRIDNTLAQMPERLTAVQAQLDKADVDGALKQVEQIFKRLEADVKRMQRSAEDNKKIRGIAMDVTGAGKLTRTLAELLVDRVYVYPDNRIEIDWVISDFVDCAYSEKEDGGIKVLVGA